MYRNALSIDPFRKPTYLQLASACEMMGDYRAAADALKQLRTMEDDEEALLMLDEFISRIEKKIVDRTAPVDINLGDSPQPFGYAIPQGHANPIRTLVFDNNPVTSVVFCIDGDVSCSEMQPVDGGPLWQGFWDSTTVAGGPHTIVVRAEGSTTSEDRIDTLVNPAQCLGDGDRDGDVDGSDLAALIEDHVSPVVLDFVDCFGRTGG